MVPVLALPRTPELIRFPDRYLSSLETRLGLVENDIRSIKHGTITATTPGTSQEGSRLSAPSNTPEDTAIFHARNNDTDIQLDDRDGSEDPFIEGVTDGMGVTFADEEDSGFFGILKQVLSIGNLAELNSGPTSNTAFMRHTSAAAKRVSDAFQPRPQHHTLERLRMEGSFMHTAQVSSSVRPRLSASQAHKVDIYALPSHEEALQLLDQYFRGTGLVFPYLDEDTFLAAYAEARLSGFRTTRKTWLGLLNIVLALATTTSLRSDIVAETRFERSDVYYRRAVGLCEKQMMRGTSLEIGKNAQYY